MTDAVIPPELAALAADVESAEPAFVILPDKAAPYWWAAAAGAVKTLGLDAWYQERWPNPLGTLEEVANEAEEVMTALQEWLIEHDVPKLGWWFSHDGVFLYAELKGTESGRYTDADDSEV